MKTIVLIIFLLITSICHSQTLWNIPINFTPTEKFSKISVIGEYFTLDNQYIPNFTDKYQTNFDVSLSFEKDTTYFFTIYNPTHDKFLLIEYDIDKFLEQFNKDLNKERRNKIPDYYKNYNNQYFFDNISFDIYYGKAELMTKWKNMYLNENMVNVYLWWSHDSGDFTITLVISKQ